jgi:uncharacterized membrane protein
MANGITIESLHNDLVAIRNDLVAIRHDIVRLEAKIDSKPNLMAMFTGIFIVVFGMAGVIASTIATLHTLGFIHHA